MTQQLTLYIGDKNISTWSMRAWVALKYKGVPFKEITISLPTDKDRTKRREVSPTGKVPVLHHGKIAIPDSLAIIEYLEETFPAPKHPAIWPSSSADRARARWLAATMHSGFTNLRASMTFNLCFLPKPPTATPEAIKEAGEMLFLWEKVLTEKTQKGQFLLGDFSGADIMFAPAVVRLVSFKVPTEKTPKAADWMRTILSYPIVEAWLSEARALEPRKEY